MSITKEIVIWCDACANWERFATGNLRVARRRARDGGWVRKYWLDFCPQCPPAVQK